MEARTRPCSCTWSELLLPPFKNRKEARTAMVTASQVQSELLTLETCEYGTEPGQTRSAVP